MHWQYSDGIFDYLNLGAAVRGLERAARTLAKNMADGEEVASDMDELNKRKEEVMTKVTSAMVAREKSLRRPRKHHAKAAVALEGPAFVACHKTRICGYVGLKKGSRREDWAM